MVVAVACTKSVTFTPASGRPPPSTTRPASFAHGREVERRAVLERDPRDDARVAADEDREWRDAVAPETEPALRVGDDVGERRGAGGDDGRADDGAAGHEDRAGHVDRDGRRRGRRRRGIVGEAQDGLGRRAAVVRDDGRTAPREEERMEPDDAGAVRRAEDVEDGSSVGRRGALGAPRLERPGGSLDVPREVGIRDGPTVGAEDAHPHRASGPDDDGQVRGLAAAEAERSAPTTVGRRGLDEHAADAVGRRDRDREPALGVGDRPRGRPVRKAGDDARARDGPAVDVDDEAGRAFGEREGPGDGVVGERRGLDDRRRRGRPAEDGPRVPCRRPGPEDADRGKRQGAGDDAETDNSCAPCAHEPLPRRSLPPFPPGVAADSGATGYDPVRSVSTAEQRGRSPFVGVDSGATGS